MLWTMLWRALKFRLRVLTFTRMTNAMHENQLSPPCPPAAGKLPKQQGRHLSLLRLASSVPLYLYISIRKKKARRGSGVACIPDYLSSAFLQHPGFPPRNSIVSIRSYVLEIMHAKPPSDSEIPCSRYEVHLNVKERERKSIDMRIKEISST